jgi:hypothetical protein
VNYNLNPFDFPREQQVGQGFMKWYFSFHLAKLIGCFEYFCVNMQVNKQVYAESHRTKQKRSFDAGGTKTFDDP